MVDNFKVRDAAEQRVVEFLIVELETGLTFSRIASDSRYSDKRDRNRANARKAYDTALGWTKRLSLNAEDSLEVGEKLKKLKAALEKLGERFDANR